MRPTTSETTLDVPQGTFELHRFPLRAKSTLRAWDAADHYVLDHLAEVAAVSELGWLVVNDGFGALGLALAEHNPQSWSDSFLAHQGAAGNCVANGLDASVFGVVPSTDEPKGPIGVAVVKIPKTLALLEDQLCRLKPLLTSDATVVGAGMARHIHTSTIELFDKIIGPTTTSLARRKARLIFASVDTTIAPRSSPYPSRWSVGDGPHAGLATVNHANVFSRAKLDIGTRVMLNHLPSRADLGGVAAEGPPRVIDLGCGNGVLGTAVASVHEGAEITFVDESYMAVASARETFESNHPGRAAVTRAGNVLDGVDDASVDLVINNPPFHDNHAVGDAVAWDMFKEAHRVLRRGGEIRVVANRHLAHHSRIAKIFGNVTVVGNDHKFTVLQARR